MITTFNAMPSPVSRRPAQRWPIIAALLVVAAALAGCGVALKLGYGQGSALAFRWLDGYVDFNDAQTLRVRSALDEWFAWNRRTQLPDYADLLARTGIELQTNTTPERVCVLADEVRARIDTGFEHARPAVIDVAATLTPQQLARIQNKLDDRNATFRDDYLQPDPADRREASVEREASRAEDLYGSLGDAQRAMLEKSVAESPFDGDLAYAERLRRQQDMLSMLRRLAAPQMNRTEAEAEIGTYVQRLDRSPNDDYRRYTKRLVAYNCAFAAALHNSTSAEQRRFAAKKLLGYERELRDLAGAASAG
jgi:hypothetical protein